MSPLPLRQNFVMSAQAFWHLPESLNIHHFDHVVEVIVINYMMGADNLHFLLHLCPESGHHPMLLQVHFPPCELYQSLLFLVKHSV
ncbi:hypothetical protein D9M73_230450 [compost metagenome]